MCVCVPRSYLKLCKQHVFLELVSVPESMWIVLAFILICDLYWRGVTRTQNPLDPELAMCACTLLWS